MSPGRGDCRDGSDRASRLFVGDVCGRSKDLEGRQADGRRVFKGQPGQAEAFLLESALRLWGPIH